MACELATAMDDSLNGRSIQVRPTPGQVLVVRKWHFTRRREKGFMLARASVYLIQ
jgi:hypothetical protein